MSEKKQKPVLLWILILLTVAAIGYFSYPTWKPWVRENILASNSQPENQITGSDSLLYNTWISEIDGAMLTLKPNGCYSLDVPSVEEGKTVFGHYKLQGKQIIFVNHPSSGVCEGIEGAYRYTCSNGQITFKVLSDGCKSRKYYLSSGWFIL